MTTTEAKTSVEVETVTTIRITSRVGSSWALLSWDASGLVHISSDHGRWTHFWNPRHIGETNIPGFLAQLDVDYAGGKFLGGKLYINDVEKTVKGLRSRVLELRRQEDLEQDAAREEWERLEDIHNESELDEFYRNTELEEPWYHQSTRMEPAWRNFWDLHWIAMRPELHKLAAAESA